MCPRHKVPRDRGQRLGSWQIRDAPARLVDQLLGVNFGLFEAHERRVSLLVGCLVLAGRLPELLGRSRNVEDVVHNLKRQPDLPSKCAQPRHSRKTGALIAA